MVEASQASALTQEPPFSYYIGSIIDYCATHCLIYELLGLMKATLVKNIESPLPMSNKQLGLTKDVDFIILCFDFIFLYFDLIYLYIDLKYL